MLHWRSVGTGKVVLRILPVMVPDCARTLKGTGTCHLI